MARLSWPIENIKRQYEVVVVGSGYGGAIAASRLSRAGRRVCVLERGREFQPGEYPDTLREAWGQSQVDGPLGHIGPRTGLYDLRINREIGVFMGCGLGGTSLVNAGVALEPDPRVFDDPAWPSEVRSDVRTLLADGFRRSAEMLNVSSYPQDFPRLAKLEALERSANLLGEGTAGLEFYRPPIAVSFRDGPNHVGVAQQACKLCGDCVSGCNYAAKNTLITNYLPDARTHGAEIFTRAWVQRLERRPDGRWVVHFQLMDSGREKFDAPTLFVIADLVVLAAGTLGSTEILLRSRSSELPLSSELGRHFTGNGDVLAFGYNNDVRINGVGLGAHPAGEPDPVGPTITGIIDMRRTSRLEDGMVIEEGAIPGLLSGFLPEVLAQIALLVGRDTDEGFMDFVHEKAREWGGLFRGRYSDALRDTQTYLVMAHDDGRGWMELEDDRLRIRWPEVGDQAIFGTINDRLDRATEALGGTYVKNPLWSRLFGKDLITVHPLGGCVMGGDATLGVVNHKGQVFSGPSGADVYDNLYVCDGSIIPRPLGVNPLLTISALAERCCALMATDRGWSFGYALPSVTPSPEEKAPIGIQFTETMRGFLSTKVTQGDYRAAAVQGLRDGSRFEFTLTISSDDLERMLADPDHEARMIGTVRAPTLSESPLLVNEGRFNLFMADPERPDSKRMRYRMDMTTEDGRAYYFEGFKVIRDDPGVDVWSDTTTLYITVHDGESDADPILGRGILRIRPKDFMRQLTTMEVSNAGGVLESLQAKARFGRYFAGVLFDTYGALLI